MKLSRLLLIFALLLGSTGSIAQGNLRTVLTANLNIYVNTVGAGGGWSAGSDSNDGFSLAAPFLTWQRACDYIGFSLDLAGYRVVVNFNSGTIRSGCMFQAAPPGTCYGCIEFRPYTGNLGDVTIDTTWTTSITTGSGMPGFWFANEASLQAGIVRLYHLKFTNQSSGAGPTGAGTIANCVEATGGFLILQGVWFNNCALAAVYGRHGGQPQFVATQPLNSTWPPNSLPGGTTEWIQYSGTFGYLLACQSGATCYIENSAIKFVSATSCSYLCWLADGAGVWAFNIYWDCAGTPCSTTSNVTGQRFLAAKNGFLYTGVLSVNYLPGNSPGGITQNGAYDKLPEPTLSGSCGTAGSGFPVVYTGSTDFGGGFAWGASGTGPCTLTFQTYWWYPPLCTFFWVTNVALMQATTTTSAGVASVTFNQTSGTNNNVRWSCALQPNPSPPGLLAMGVNQESIDLADRLAAGDALLADRRPAIAAAEVIRARFEQHQQQQ